MHGLRDETFNTKGVLRLSLPRAKTGRYDCAICSNAHSRGRDGPRGPRSIKTLSNATHAAPRGTPETGRSAAALQLRRFANAQDCLATPGEGDNWGWVTSGVPRCAHAVFSPRAARLRAATSSKRDPLGVGRREAGWAWLYYSTLSLSCGAHRKCSAPGNGARQKLIRLGRVAQRLVRTPT